MYKGDRQQVQTAWLSFRLKNALVGLKLYDPEDGVFTLRQIHSNRVVLLEEESQEEGDAIITTRKNFPVGVRTADCVPLAFLGERAVGVVHAGWKGIKAGIVEKFLESFLPIEKDPFVFVGPSAKACCYEVGQEFKQSFEVLHYKKGRLYMDTQLEVVKKLRNHGIKRLFLYRECTICNQKFPSHRRNKTSQRILLFAVLT